MKKLLASLITLPFLGLGSMSLAADQPEPGTASSNQQKPAVAKPVPGKVNPEVARLEEMIAKKKEFATRAKFTPEGEEQYKKELADMENRLARLKKEPEIVICIFPPDPGINPKPFPAHWGKPPAGQTKDLRPLPGGFGMGSGTLARWIEENMEADKKAEKPVKPGEKPDPGTKPEKGKFGLWLDKDGFIIPGPKTADFIDSDRDGIDDRVQPKPGSPAAKPRPEKPDGGGKPETGGPDPKPEKPDGQLGGGKRPKPPAPFRPKQPRPELPEVLQTQVDAFEAGQKTLREALKTQIDALGEDASREDVKAAAEAFKADNKEAIEAQIAAGKALHEAIKENRPAREKIARPEPPAAVKEKAEAMKAIHQTLGKARHDLHKALKDASEEDRKAMIASFKEAQKEHHQELKVAKKALREAIRDNAETGDRRSED